jgi:hypothetical protein
MSAALAETVARLRTGEASTMELYRPSFPLPLVEEARALMRDIEAAMRPTPEPSGSSQPHASLACGRAPASIAETPRPMLRGQLDCAGPETR